MKNSKKIVILFLELLTALVGIVYVYPVLIVFINAIKPLGEILVNPFSFIRLYALL